MEKFVKPIRKAKTFKGFTLVELIVVITILAILATVGFLALSGYTQDAKDSAVKANARSVQTAISSESAITGNSPRYYVAHDTGAALSGAFVYVDGIQTFLTGWAWDQPGTNYSAGNPDWTKLKLNPEKFRLSSESSPVMNVFGTSYASYDSRQLSIGAFDAALSSGGNGKRRSSSYLQVVGIDHGTNKVSVVGNFTASWTGSVSGLVKDSTQANGTWALIDGAVIGNSAMVSGGCSGLPTNAAYFWGVASYELASAPQGTSLIASYTATPAQNTCQFSCANGIWNGSACVVSCPSGASCSGNSAEFPTAGSFTFVPVVTGTYRLEAYGSKWGNMGAYQGWLGGYAYGETTLTGGVTYYVNVWSVGTNGWVSGYGGWSPGGGATDIRAVSGNLGSRIIVWWGGGWAGWYSFGGWAGWGLTGGKGLGDDGGNGWTQTAWGAAWPYWSNPGTLGTWGTCNWGWENCWGGGGWYYGGAGGSWSGNNGGGGGWSWFVGNLANSGMQTGTNNGNGLARITKL